MGARAAVATIELDWLRRLPSERRVWADGLLVLCCHASPGSQTAGLPTDLDPTVTVERVTRTDARVIACGHTHIADVRELGRKLICQPRVVRLCRSMAMPPRAGRCSRSPISRPRQMRRLGR